LKKIKELFARLFTDCLGGFYRLATGPNADAFTFLGTLILVDEKTQEEDFSGRSVAIVDGQQRLTTLALLACAIYEKLTLGQRAIESLKLDDDVKRSAGEQKVKGTKYYPYPRIIRANDRRGRSQETSKYYSPLGQFLDAFAKYANEEKEDEEFLPPSIGSGSDAKRLGENYELIRQLLNKLNDREWYEDTECEQMPVAWLDRPGYRSLLDRIADIIKNENDRNRAIDQLRSCNAAHDLIRTLLFAAYFCRCIVLTRVTTDDESAAFDIFDALNTV